MFSCYRCLSDDTKAADRERLLRCNPQQAGSNLRAFNIQDLPTAAISRLLASLPFDERCKASLVCACWRSIINSAAAHDQHSTEELASGSGSTAASGDWTITRAGPYDVTAVGDQQQYKLQACPAIKHASSACVWLCSAGLLTLHQLSSVTKLQLLDPHLDLEHSKFSPREAAAELIHLRKLSVLNLGMAGPLVDFRQLPSSLQCLHLNLSSGYSVSQLATSCRQLAAAASKLPNLRHISLGMELDALLSNSRGEVLTPLSALTQLTSLQLSDYQHMHPDSPAHEGYYVVPPVVEGLAQLAKLDLRLCSGHKAQLQAAAAVPDVSLVLTLARHEQMPFNRLPASLTLVSGLTSLTLLMAEYDYESDSGLYVFDASPLVFCQRLSSLLLELHGSKCHQHDLRGLAQLQHLQDLVVLLKCPDVHEGRPEGQPAAPSVGSAAGAEVDGLGDAAGAGAAAAAAATATPSMRMLSWLSSSSGSKLLLATTNRLLLRQPDNILQCRQPMVLASHLQVDCDSCLDSWSGESFLQQRSPRAIRSWAGRHWQPWGVKLHMPARYPQLGRYPSCEKRIDDKLLVVSRLGVSAPAVVATLMDIVEERCISYFY
eukprot:gene12991-13120_t